MDPIQIIGGADGLKHIAAALRNAGCAIDAVYLIKLTNSDDREDWVVRPVTREPAFDVVFKFLALQDEGKIPRIGDRFRIDPVSPDNPEASRIIAYARRFARTPVEIESVILDRMLIDYALVAELPGADAAAA